MPLTKGFFKEYQSFIWYGAFVFALIGLLSYRSSENLDQMLDKPSLYLNYDGTFKSERARELAQRKEGAFWQHQLSVINRELSFKDDLLKDNEAIREAISIGRNAEDASNKALLRDLAMKGDKFAALALSNHTVELQLKRATEDLERANRLRLQLSYFEERRPELLHLKTFVEGQLGK